MRAIVVLASLLFTACGDATVDGFGWTLSDELVTPAPREIGSGDDVCAPVTTDTRLSIAFFSAMLTAMKGTLAILVVCCLGTSGAAVAAPGVSSSGNAPAYLVAGATGIRLVGKKRSRMLVRLKHHPKVLVDTARGWLWFSGVGLSVIDLRNLKAPAVQVVSVGGNDFGIKYPKGGYIATNNMSVSMSVDWDAASAVTIRPGPTPTVNKKWLAANRKRAMKPRRTPWASVKRSIAFGRTGHRLVVRPGQPRCTLVDRKGRKRAPDTVSGRADEYSCYESFVFDRTRKWWITRGLVCNALRCYEVAKGVSAVGWVKPGLTIEIKNPY